MEENIETKDVQRTEYLDKNGLDMLWTKVKENTHNQVEVEYNRAKAKEDSLSQEIASVKPAEGKVFLQVEETGGSQRTIKGGTLAITGAYPEDSNEYMIASRSYIYLNRREPNNFSDLNITATGISSTNRNSDTKVWNTNGGITDLANYAKKTDIPEVDTSDFVSKTATDTQIINSGLGIVGGDIQIIDSLDSENSGVQLSHNAISFNGRNKFAIELNGLNVDNNNDEGHVLIATDHENPSIELSKLPNGSSNFQRRLKITNEGISNTDNNANHVFATDGSTIDITQYALKSQLPTVPTKVSQLQNDSNFAYKEVVDRALELFADQISGEISRKQNKIIPGNIDISAANFQNTIVSLKETIMSLITTLEKSGLITVTRSQLIIE